MRLFRAYGYIALPILAGLIVFALSLLISCAPVDQSIATRPPAQLARPSSVDLRPICPKVKEYTDQQLSDLGAALQAIPDSSPLIPAIADYKRMRAEGRACASAAK